MIGSPLRCDAITAAEGRSWAQLLIWAESDLNLEVKGPSGNSLTVEPKNYRHLSSEIAQQWSEAVSSRHQSQVKILRNMNVLADLNDRLHNVECKGWEVRGERGHHLYFERLPVNDRAVSAGSRDGVPFINRMGVQLGLASLVPPRYVSKNVLDAATASAAKAFRWRTWEGADEVSETAPILLSCDWWTLVMSKTNHEKISKRLRCRFAGCNVPTLVGAFHEFNHYAAVRITMASASIVVRDSRRTTVKSEWSTKLISLCKWLQQHFPEACQEEPTCVSGDTELRQLAGNVDCAMFAFANITALAEDNAKTCPADVAASLRGKLAQVLWTRGTWNCKGPELQQHHPAEFTGADITLLREWKEEFLRPLAGMEEGVASCVDDARDSGKDGRASNDGDRSSKSASATGGGTKVSGNGEIVDSHSARVSGDVAKGSGFQTGVSHNDRRVSGVGVKAPGDDARVYADGAIVPGVGSGKPDCNVRFPGAGVRTPGDDARVCGNRAEVPGDGSRVPSDGVRDARAPGKAVKTPGDQVSVPGNAARSSGDGVRVSGDGVRVSGDGGRASGDAARVSGDGVWVSGDGVEISGDGLGISGDGVRFSGDGVRVSGDGVRVSGDGVRVSGDSGRVSDEGDQARSEGSGVSGNTRASGEYVKAGGTDSVMDEGVVAWSGTTSDLRSDFLARYFEGLSSAVERRLLFNALWELSAPDHTFCGPDPAKFEAFPQTLESTLSLPSSFWERLQGRGGVNSVHRWMKALGNLAPRKILLPYSGLLSEGVISWNVAKGQVGIYPFVSTGRRAWTSGEEARFRDAVGFMMATSLGQATSLRRVDIKWPRPRGTSPVLGPDLRRQLATLLQPKQGSLPETALADYVSDLARLAQRKASASWTENFLSAYDLPRADSQAASVPPPPTLPYSSRFNNAAIVSCNLGPAGWWGNETTIRALVRSRPALILLQDVRLREKHLGSNKFRNQLARVAPGYKAFFTARSLPAEDAGRAPYPMACITLYHESLGQTERVSEKGGREAAARGRVLGTVHHNPRHKTTLLCVNVYLPVAGQEAQFDECWSYARDLVQRMTEKYPDLHVVLAGDFNTAFSTKRVGYSSKKGDVHRRDTKTANLPCELNLQELPLQPAESRDAGHSHGRDGRRRDNSKQPS